MQVFSVIFLEALPIVTNTCTIQVTYSTGSPEQFRLPVATEGANVRRTGKGPTAPFPSLVGLPKSAVNASRLDPLDNMRLLA